MMADRGIGTMTVVAIWFEPFDQVIWAVADTRVSRLGPVASTITDMAAKLLPLSLRCFQPGEHDFVNDLTLQTSFGFAYAGNTLPALMTYTVANTCLQNLISRSGASPPSLADVAAVVQRIGQRYILEIMADFEAVVFGWCPVEHRYRAVLLSPETKCANRHVSAYEQPLYNTEFVSLLGVHRTEVTSEITTVLQELEGLPLKRAPKIAIQNLVSKGSLPAIGGTLQIGTATELGFELKSYERPIISGQPLSARFFLGIDIDHDIGQVGSYAIGMTGTI
jgi:hypothetical protein